MQYNLSVTLDINIKLKDRVRKTNCLFVSFPRVGPLIMTHLFQSYCLLLHGSSLWLLPSPALHYIEVALNKILCKIWHLHSRNHTAIVHLVAKLDSLFKCCLSSFRFLCCSQLPNVLHYSFVPSLVLLSVIHFLAIASCLVFHILSLMIHNIMCMQLCENVIRELRCYYTLDDNFET